MSTRLFEINLKGKVLHVPSICIEGKTVVVLGKWLRIARVYDEEWMEVEAVDDPDFFITQLRKEGPTADIFTFAQRIPDTEPKYQYPVTWDNAAVVPITTYAEWWEKRLPQVSRKNVRRAIKRGVIARPVVFDDDLVRDLVALFDETVIKQGRPFAHHGKDFAAVKRDLSSMLERSEFIGAYYGSELIGFIKLVYMGKIASILHILTKDKHYDKRPTNILIAKAVEICEQKKVSHLWFGRYTYGNKTDCSLRDFKHRNGFEELRFPAYYVPLTLRGRIAILLRLHRGVIGLLPAKFIAYLLKARSKLFQLLLPQFRSSRTARPPVKEGEESKFEGETH